MDSSVTLLRPEPQVLQACRLPRSRLLGAGGRRLMVEPSQVAIASIGGRPRLVAPRGDRAEVTEVDSEGGVVLVIPRNPAVYLTLRECRFADAVGDLTLRAEVRLLAPSASGQHPILRLIGQPATCEGLRGALGDAIRVVLTDPLVEHLRGVCAAQTGCGESLSETLASLCSDQRLRTALARCFGFALTSHPTVTHVAATRCERATGVSAGARDQGHRSIRASLQTGAQLPQSVLKPERRRPLPAHRLVE